MGNARIICSYLLTLGTEEGVFVRFHFWFTQLCQEYPHLGVQELPQRTRSAFMVKQDEAMLSLANFYKFLGLICGHQAISPCFTKQKHQENGISTCVLFNLYTLCMKVLVTQLCLTLCNPMDCSLLLSMEFSRQEYWSGLPFPSPGIFPTWGLNLDLLHCSRFFTVWATRDAWSKYEFASRHLDARNVTVLKLALNTPSPREWDVQYQVLLG